MLLDCWISMYKWWHDDPKVEQIWIIDNAGGKDGISAKVNGIKGVFDSGIMKDIQRSWS